MDFFKEHHRAILPNFSWLCVNMQYVLRGVDGVIVTQYVCQFYCQFLLTKKLK